jgi:hypothetical protein
MSSVTFEEIIHFHLFKLDSKLVIGITTLAQLEMANRGEAWGKEEDPTIRLSFPLCSRS